MTLLWYFLTTRVQNSFLLLQIYSCTSMASNLLLCHQSMLQEENCQKKCDKEGKDNTIFYECKVFTSGDDRVYMQYSYVLKAGKKSHITSLQN